MLSEVEDESFAIAAGRTAAEHTGVEDSAVEAKVQATLNGGGLLTGVNVLYDLNITSNMTQSAVISRLRTAFDNGAFLTSLKSFSGLNITSASQATILDVTPTSSPTATPSGSDTPSIQSLAPSHSPSREPSFVPNESGSESPSIQSLAPSSGNFTFEPSAARRFSPSQEPFSPSSLSVQPSVPPFSSESPSPTVSPIITTKLLISQVAKLTLSIEFVCCSVHAAAFSFLKESTLDILFP